MARFHKTIKKPLKGWRKLLFCLSMGICSLSPAMIKADPLLPWHVEEADWLKAAIQNKTDLQAEVWIQIRWDQRAISGQHGRSVLLMLPRHSMRNSRWIKYTIDPQETINIVCRICDYVIHKFELAGLKKQAYPQGAPIKKHAYYTLKPNAFYMIDYNESGGWKLFGPSINSVYTAHT